MALIFLKDNINTPLALEPYRTLNEKLSISKNELDGYTFEIPVENVDQKIVEGFYNDKYYAFNFLLKFSFAQNMNSRTKGEDEWIIRHTLRFEFDHDFKDIEEDTLGEITSRYKYFYLIGANYYEYSYNVTFQNKAEMVFDVLSDFENIKEICRQLISYDIALFARGY